MLVRVLRCFRHCAPILAEYGRRIIRRWLRQILSLLFAFSNKLRILVSNTSFWRCHLMLSTINEFGELILMLRQLRISAKIILIFMVRWNIIFARNFASLNHLSTLVVRREWEKYLLWISICKKQIVLRERSLMQWWRMEYEQTMLRYEQKMLSIERGV